MKPLFQGDRIGFKLGALAGECYFTEAFYPVKGIFENLRDHFGTPLPGYFSGFKAQHFLKHRIRVNEYIIYGFPVSVEYNLVIGIPEG
ncbi:hypothetical protein K7J14_03890 [Treponema zuelzerae]|uniref:Uncharacterized protein n=1 Tax=Teretinema zuelzerae TaxID=156 RepID=A0AAE3EHE6_9SPIR|nr:hypothetical protein [Teretinema zuelzerae]MCD1653841.1 hypothetical protein [Teretinema zuelzerae]